MLLTLGVLLWAGIHLFPAVAPNARAAVIERIGLWPYKGLFALGIVAALLVIIFGWRAMPPTSLWVPPMGMRSRSTIAATPKLPSAFARKSNRLAVPGSRCKGIPVSKRIFCACLGPLIRPSVLSPGWSTMQAFTGQGGVSMR